ncbi:hypothetical protein TKK_0002769 [Trichogramma kaykai]|uniref:Uncharacterized protein n=1 Tax=Trichogramma kaykai TaxID=54128 RepID=A0ABD2XUC9_9HYME
MSSHNETMQQQQQQQQKQYVILELPLPTYEEVMREKQSRDVSVFTISKSRPQYVEQTAAPGEPYWKSPDGNRLYRNDNCCSNNNNSIASLHGPRNEINFIIFKYTLYTITAFSLLAVFLILLKDFRLVTPVQFPISNTPEND